MPEGLSGVAPMRMLGDHLMMIEAYPQAAKAYHRAITRAEGDLLKKDRVGAAELHARMASALLAEDLFLEAPPYISEAIALDAGNPYVRYVHAFMLHAEGSAQEALDTLDGLALEARVQPWVTVARADFDPTGLDAVGLARILAEAVTRLPMSGALHARFSAACERIGNHMSAVEHACIAAWLQPHLLRRWLRNGDVAMLANAHFDAADAFEAAREISPFDPRIDALIARAQLVGGDLDEAAACVLRGLRKNNSHPDCLTVLEQLKKPNTSRIEETLIPFERNREAKDAPEAFIFVPPWPT